MWKQLGGPIGLGEGQLNGLCSAAGCSTAYIYIVFWISAAICFLNETRGVSRVLPTNQEKTK
jgi:hypothetical protein